MAGASDSLPRALGHLSPQLDTPRDFTPRMDYQAALRQKDAELEERAQLLLKTKAAIEQLQEELGNSRRQNEAQRKVGGVAGVWGARS